ncbi:MAG TPA: hypothetical protein VLB44_19345, partial [Kofleriaceae bacterium]|nr:hypothetical protein [Kofleriaceae bacterium]
AIAAGAVKDEHEQTLSSPSLADRGGAPESGELEMGVPAGRYDVSFEACAPHSGCSGRAERIQQVEVSPDAPAEVSWTCELSAM